MYSSTGDYHIRSLLSYALARASQPTSVPRKIHKQRHARHPAASLWCSATSNRSERSATCTLTAVATGTRTSYELHAIGCSLPRASRGYARCSKMSSTRIMRTLLNPAQHSKCKASTHRDRQHKVSGRCQLATSASEESENSEWSHVHRSTPEGRNAQVETAM